MLIVDIHAFNDGGEFGPRTDIEKIVTVGNPQTEEFAVFTCKHGDSLNDLVKTDPEGTFILDGDPNAQQIAYASLATILDKRMQVPYGDPDGVEPAVEPAVDEVGLHDEVDTEDEN